MTRVNSSSSVLVNYHCHFIREDEQDVVFVSEAGPTQRIADPDLNLVGDHDISLEGDTAMSAEEDPDISVGADYEYDATDDTVLFKRRLVLFNYCCLLCL